ncbi:hypothetical protein T11_8477 [Trichinella zimbabwensis]|uniref:Uncharacterized protein n=1 Tax=Trichinella zimbabwensis TaxID=268475 RepID=A0A0V1F4X7_9BILA|nr:hypothetical protein T11_8477 [Trichinella zimbabwensis]
MEEGTHKEAKPSVGCGVGENLFPFCRLSFCPIDGVL